ncbi:hypothetical protein B5M42_008275 [Paenibacillus athensensis]|uniref:DUF4190 domain-containing protein n=1 Tax=Paenibacillus athensensis TaxID=1967502 RepID=A0A4Y8PW45_9BACL|nr:hypothetical protein [Paenibacillus athensensis]MCD1258830.1 hypothetical protein [Paenibacillus athensensis]
MPTEHHHPDVSPQPSLEDTTNTAYFSYAALETQRFGGPPFAPVAPKSPLPNLALVFGLIGLGLNLLLLTVPLGLPCTLTAFVLGLISRSRYRRSGGLTTALLSLLVLAYWLASFLVPVLIDPTLFK